MIVLQQSDFSQRATAYLTKLADTAEPILLTRYGAPTALISTAKNHQGLKGVTVAQAERKHLIARIAGLGESLAADAKRSGDEKGADAIEYFLDVIRGTFE